jgi:predicted enzyme related to lactoylglutathione lyase
MALTVHSVTFDCADPQRQARFWSAALGSQVADVGEKAASVAIPGGVGPRLLFLKVPEGKRAKNRVHLDLASAGAMESEVERLVRLGARRLRLVEEEGDFGVFTVMQDPEGNEFCVEA